jgi:hypothetical protein
MASISQVSKPRDLRLDFFRGLALLIIFVAHVPNNWLAPYRPGCFGFSDSADIFVFVSGWAAAYAYGGAFAKAGFIAGCARVLRRCAQLYAGHLGLFFSVAALCVAGNRFLETGVDYINLLNLSYFFDHAEDALVWLFTLTYVPNYFDILPMYLVCLAMLPPFILLSRLHPVPVALVSIALYSSVYLFGLNLPAEIAFERPWFFNPFAWQFLFYTGFFIGAGWLKTPPSSVWLAVLSAVFIVMSIPFGHYPTYSRVAWMEDFVAHADPLISKTNLGILRLLHFLCLAYLAGFFLRGKERMLESSFASPLIKTGQQPLPVFLTGMFLSYLTGMVLDVLGRDWLSTSLTNAGGILALVAVAYLSAWFKSQPWRVRIGLT